MRFSGQISCVFALQLEARSLPWSSRAPAGRPCSDGAAEGVGEPRSCDQSVAAVERTCWCFSACFSFFKEVLGWFQPQFCCNKMAVGWTKNDRGPRPELDLPEVPQGQTFKLPQLPGRARAPRRYSALDIPGNARPGRPGPVRAPRWRQLWKRTTDVLIWSCVVWICSICDTAKIRWLMMMFPLKFGWKGGDALNSEVRAAAGLQLESKHMFFGHLWTQYCAST